MQCNRKAGHRHPPALSTHPKGSPLLQMPCFLPPGAAPLSNCTAQRDRQSQTYNSLFPSSNPPVLAMRMSRRDLPAFSRIFLRRQRSTRLYFPMLRFLPHRNSRCTFPNSLPGTLPGIPARLMLQKHRYAQLILLKF